MIVRMYSKTYLVKMGFNVMTKLFRQSLSVEKQAKWLSF